MAYDLNPLRALEAIFLTEGPCVDSIRDVSLEALDDFASWLLSDQCAFNSSIILP